MQALRQALATEWLRVTQGISIAGSPILNFVQRYASPIVLAQAKRRRHHVENGAAAQVAGNIDSRVL